jgi:hypothetical protein
MSEYYLQILNDKSELPDRNLCIMNLCDVLSFDNI